MKLFFLRRGQNWQFDILFYIAFNRVVTTKKEKLQKNNFLLLWAVIAVVVLVVYLFIQKNHPLSEAARGGKPVSGSANISLNEVDPHLGDTITFTTSGGKLIAVSCFQGGLGNMVYAVEQPVGTSFVLKSPTWSSTGEDATCIAYLYNKNLSDRVVVSTIFHVISATQ